MTLAKGGNRYAAIIERIFLSRYREGTTRVEFARDELSSVAAEIGLSVPKNLGDILYSFRYRSAMPDVITSTAPEGMAWVIRSVGRGSYCIDLAPELKLEPSPVMVETKIPDATPGIVALYCQTDEQALLARLRYNRLIDVFTGVVCHSLQSHLRTTVPGMGQVETDELYVGIDRRGIHYILPVQAKGGKDSLHVVQIEQDLALCAARFRTLVCRPIAAQFMDDRTIALFELEATEHGVALSMERHYRLVPPDQVTANDLRLYQERLPGS